MFCYASGARYEGEWKDNAKHGFGKFFFKDGTIFAGIGSGKIQSALSSDISCFQDLF